ncbi:uncharacterized protein LOC128603201 isoform X2 [Ictalurus furcatus]|uniref:uncharacterized protein LOC128603201 isoform X2 n=1 Tax=Ictalurus furcatus TaxID=66913 RepID=UPI002350EE17|nr:uncharacterized protein LOC128603201 isoform X2 [Ictalurus furcatus]XP_053473444.1 uncharacterized protein LOC128603201 isoform X2 [Ictalurus furcatus]XP_053473445.1 uncharacterized protein LOC128603201 isoform X2 [Ictalurus furcatus]
MAASDLRYISGDVHRVSEVSIVLLGCRNSGKSLAGNVILGRKDLDLQESTRSVKRHGEVAGRKITLVEAPGWCSDKPVTESTELLNEEIVRGVSVYPPGPQAVLVVVNCGDVFKENDRERLAGCLNLLGDEVWSHTIVLFTFGDFLGDVTIERHIEREGVALQWLVEKCGNRYHVFKNNMDDDSQVMELLEKIEEMVAVNRGCRLEMDTTMLPNVDESRIGDDSKERRTKGMKYSHYFMNVCMYFLKFLQVFWFSSELWSIAHSTRVRMGSPRDLQFPPASRKHAAEDFREPSGTGKGARSTSSLHPDAGHVSADTEIFTPELVDNYPNDKNRMKYRFLCPRAGQFKCKLTDLVFEMEGKGELLYRIVSWDGCVSDELKDKEPAGPLYSIDCLEGSIRHLHLPHCEIDWGKHVLQLTVAHVTGGNVEIIQPLKVTSTHVIVDVRRFSLVGLLKALLFQAYPIRAQVLLFCEETGKHRMSKLHVHLLPGNVPVEEVQKQRNCTYTYIETRSKCQLTPDKTYRPCFRTTDCDYVSQPEDETFVRDYGPDYHSTFEVQFNTELDKFTLSLLDENGQEVWRPDLVLLTEGFREHDGTRKDARSAATLHLDSGHASTDTELIFSPELVENCPKDKNGDVYRFLCPHAGLYMCKLTNLVFEMEGKGVVVYRIVSWDSHVLDGLQKDSAGPLYSIECLEGSIRHLRLPHCETRTDVVKLTVAHATGGNVEIIQPLKVTDTHVIIHIHGLSLFGLLKALLFQAYPIRAQVLLFRKKMTGKHSRSKLNIHLLPGNVPVKEVQKQRECNENIETTSKCQLTPGKLYRLCCKTTDRDYEPQPEEETFDLDYGPNYHPTFEVLFNTELDEITLSLLDENGQEVWTPREVSLLTDTEAVSANTDTAGADFVDKHRETLIQRVPSVIEIADVLKGKKMISDEMYYKIETKEIQQEQMRELYRCLTSTAVKAEFYKILQEKRQYILEDL